MNFLNSLTLPANGSSTKYAVSEPYVCTIEKGNEDNIQTIINLATEENKFLLINISYKNRICSIIYNNGEYQLLNGSIPDVDLYYSNTELTASIGTTIQILGGCNITSKLGSNNGMSSLSLTKPTPTIYTGSDAPDSKLGDVGDLYILIIPSSTSTGE